MIEAFMGTLVGIVIGFLTMFIWSSYVDILSFCLGGIFGIVIAIVMFVLYMILSLPGEDERSLT